MLTDTCKNCQYWIEEEAVSLGSCTVDSYSLTTVSNMACDRLLKRDGEEDTTVWMCANCAPRRYWRLEVPPSLTRCAKCYRVLKRGMRVCQLTKT